MNDAQVHIRDATPQDSEKLSMMFSRTSSETVYNRFHIPFPQVPEWMVDFMLGTDARHKEALVAVADDEIIGHAMYVRLENITEAEMAIIVEDGWQSNGVGKSLLSELDERARRRGIDTFVGEVLGTNRAMLALAATFSGTGHTMDDGACQVRIPLLTLHSRVPDAQPLRHAA
jgi:GNAT superfamily N-acetyltransferase